jgi:hypothetical protein
MVQHGVIIGLQLLEGAVLDGALPFVMGNPSAGLGLFVGMVANLNQGLDYIFECIVIVVVEQQTFLFFDQFFRHYVDGFLFLVHFNKS